MPTPRPVTLCCPRGHEYEIAFEIASASGAAPRCPICEVQRADAMIEARKRAAVLLPSAPSAGEPHRGSNQSGARSPSPPSPR